MVAFGIAVAEYASQDSLDQVEMSSVIEHTMRAIHQMDSPILSRVATELLGWYPHGTEPTVASIARQLNIPWTTATRYCAEVRSIFRQAYSGTLA
jgi:hypothetical protein